MDVIKDFLNKLDHRKTQHTSFIEATLGNHMLDYLWYRLRYFSVKSLLIIVIQCIEYYLLFVIFNFQTATSILIFRILGLIATRFWWGALESFRETVRKLNKEKRYTDIARLSKQWQSLAYTFALAVSLIFITVFAATYINLPAGAHGLFYFYAAAIYFEINTRIIVLTMHSTCYAINRVYRPFYSIILPSIIGLIVLALLWVPLQGYSLVLAGLSQTGLALYWTWHFTKRTLKHKHIPIDHHSIRPLKTVNPLSLKTLASATSSAFMEGGGIIILTLLHDTPSFYLLAPLLITCFSWSKLFYFDNMKYQNFWLAALLNRLNHYAYLTSLIIAIILTLIAYLILSMITQHNTPELLLALFCFFATRGLLSIRQIIQFTRRRYTRIVSMGTIQICYILTLSFLDLSMSQLLLFIALGQLVQFIITTLTQKKLFLYDKHALYLPYLPWCDLLDGHSICEIQVTDTCTTHNRDAIVHMLKQALGPGTLCTFKDDTTLYVASPTPPPENMGHWLMIHGGGFIRNFNASAHLTLTKPISNLDQFNQRYQDNKDHSYMINLKKLDIPSALQPLDSHTLFNKLNLCLMSKDKQVPFDHCYLYPLYEHHQITKLLLIKML